MGYCASKPMEKSGVEEFVHHSAYKRKKLVVYCLIKYTFIVIVLK